MRSTSLLYRLVCRNACRMQGDRSTGVCVSHLTTEFESCGTAAIATPPLGMPSRLNSMSGTLLGDRRSAPVVSSEVSVCASLVTAMTVPSWLWPMPNGSPGSVKLR